MQYLLTEEEYKAVSTNPQLLFVIDVVQKISLIPDSEKKLRVLEYVSDKLNLFLQSGNKVYLVDIAEMFE